MNRRGRAGVVLSAAVAVATAAFGGAAEDSELTRKVSDQLRMSAAIGHLGISANSRDGRVTLEGRARTLSQVREAEDLAGKVLGVTEVENRIAIDSRSAGDASIESAVKRRFDDRPDVASARLAVRSEAGAVTLSGRVRDARIRFAAEDVAASVDGVVAVIDRIETPEEDDETIRKEVAALLGNRSVVRVSGKIDVKVEAGVVTLTGGVARLYDRKQAKRLVLGINGVRGVVLRLDVSPTKRDLVIPLD